MVFVSDNEGKNIKVCFVSRYIYPLFDPDYKSMFGGSEVQLYYMATELSKDNMFTVSAVVEDFGREKEIKENVRIFGLFNSRRGIRYLRNLYEFIRMCRLLRSIDADVYVQRSASRLTGELALFCWWKKRKFVYMIAHDDEIRNKKKPVWMTGFLGSIDSMFFRIGLKLADCVVVQNEFQSHNLLKFHGRNGLFRPSAHRITANEVPQERKIILWVSRCERFKRPELFIELAKEFPRERFVMICPSAIDPEYQSSIRDSARRVENIRFLDYVSFPGVDGYFRESKIFINSSLAEGFPNTFIQAAMHGVPIVSMDVNPDHILDKHGIGKCAQGDFDAFKQQVRELLENREMYASMSRAAADYAERRHEIKTVIECDKKMLSDLLSQ